VLLRSAIIASVLLGLSPALAAGPVAATNKAVKARPVAPKKKAPSKAPASTSSAPLTADQLGLGGDEYKLSSIKANENGAPPPAAPPPVEPAPAPPPPPPVVELAKPANQDKVIVPGSGPARRFSIELNPLAAAAGRYGVNLEVALARHHVIIASPFYQTFQPYVFERIMPKAVDSSRGAPAKVGGELGYRVYTGQRGANGFFAGASGVAMPLALPHITESYKAELTSFYAFGGAVDIGIQGITDSGFTIGAGVGAMYLVYDAPKSAAVPAGVPPVNYTEPHFLPRVLLSAGWSF
jgi:hypothetical protein